MDEHNFERGLKAYEQGDYDAAFREWQTLAEQGFAEAQYRLGSMYSSGEGVEEDDAEAEEWIVRSQMI